MQIITIAGQSFIAEIVPGEGQVVLDGALEIAAASRLTKSTITNYIEQRNLGNLAAVTVAGQATYIARDLTDEEKIDFDHLEAIMTSVKKVALKKVENGQFVDAVLRG